MQVSEDFIAEVDEFHGFLKTLKEENWLQKTGFREWTPWDVVAHLHFFDELSLAALEGLDAFGREKRAVMKSFFFGMTTQEIAEKKYDDLNPERLVSKWQETAHILGQALGKADPKGRLPWFGPGMGVRMFTTGRYMETWAHAQEVYDLVSVERPQNDRIKNVVTIGVKTFGWTFQNRRKKPPGEMPYLKLSAPSGEMWEWGTPNEDSSVIGSAFEFCQVVTQVRNILDTSLQLKGNVANEWMSIAQCFAGPPVDPPEKGTRGPHKG
tara:strand:+ start:153 stop:953 length:801 start_codon:yes stop_codon:yes gene_type:complete